MLAYRHADIWAGFSQYFSYTGDEVVSKTRYLCASITTTRRKYRRSSRKRKRSKRRRRKSRRNRRRRRRKTRRRITRKRKKDVVEYCYATQLKRKYSVIGWYRNVRRRRCWR